MKIAPAALSFIACAASAKPAPTPPAPSCVAQMNDAQLDALVKSLQPLPTLDARIARASAAFVGTPYVLDPLGEGPGAVPDPDPTVRFDGVDCVTFVEETLALAESPTLADAKQLLQKIRYRGDTIAFAQRNHFMESDWIPSNEAKGFVKNITAQVGGADVIHDKRTVTVEQWKARTDATNLPDARAAVGTFDLVALPLDKVEAHARDIPNGAILVVAHKSDEKTTNRYSHLGFVIRDGDRVLVRHASSLKHAVVDDTLADFVAKNRKYVQWPVSGFVFLQPLPVNASAPAATR